MQHRWWLFCLACVAACGPDKRPGPGCGQVPDFDVVIYADVGVLPSDTRVLVEYGSGEEEYVLADPATPEVLFCTPVLLEGPTATGGTSADGGGAGVGGNGESGAGGTSSVEAPVKELGCKLWTQGPAKLTVTAAGYPELIAELKLEENVCTVTREIHLAEPDAGI